MSNLSLIRCDSRYDGVRIALNTIRDEFIDALFKATTILIKLNFVSVRNQYSATHVEAVRAVLDFLYEEVGKRKVIIGEGPAGAPLEEGLRNYGYLELIETYDIEFIDLNKDDALWVKIYDHNLMKRIKVPVSKTALNSGFRISLCGPKTHDTVVVTLTIKNMVMGAVQTPYKAMVHQSYGAINLSIAELAELLMPHLAIIDGLEGMEGNGPVAGDLVRWGVFVAGTNPVEVDALTAWLMGFNPEDIGYLYILNKRGRGRIEINAIIKKVLGEDPKLVRRRFRPHREFTLQLRWKDELEKYWRTTNDVSESGEE